MMTMLETHALTRTFGALTAVDALRTVMLGGGSSADGVGLDLVVLMLVTAALVLAGGRLYPHVVQ